MKTQGTKIIFESRAPTKQELQEFTKIHLTSKKEWNPHKVRMSEVMVSSVSLTRPNDLDEDLLESLDPYLSGLKEKLAALVPRYMAEVTRYDDSLEDIPMRQTYTSTERHVKMSADRKFGVRQLNGKFATDTIWAKSKTLRRNVSSQIYSHKCGFNAAYHLESVNGENVGYSLSKFVSDYGSPEHLAFDGAAVQVGRNTHFQNTIRKNDIKSHVSAPHRPN